MKDTYLLSSSRAPAGSASLGRSLADVLTVARNVSPPASLFGVPDDSLESPVAAAAARLLRAVFPSDACGSRLAPPGEVAVTSVLGTVSDESALELSVALTTACRDGEVLGSRTVAVPVGRHAAVGLHRPGGGLDAADLVVLQTLVWLCTEAANRPR